MNGGDPGWALFASEWKLFGLEDGHPKKALSLWLSSALWAGEIGLGLLLLLRLRGSLAEEVGLGASGPGLWLLLRGGCGRLRPSPRARPRPLLSSSLAFSLSTSEPRADELDEEGSDELEEEEMDDEGASEVSRLAGSRFVAFACFARRSLLTRFAISSNEFPAPFVRLLLACCGFAPRASTAASAASRTFFARFRLDTGQTWRSPWVWSGSGRKRIRRDVCLAVLSTRSSCAVTTSGGPRASSHSLAAKLVCVKNVNPLRPARSAHDLKAPLTHTHGSQNTPVRRNINNCKAPLETHIALFAIYGTPVQRDG